MLQLELINPEVDDFGESSGPSVRNKRPAQTKKKESLFSIGRHSVCSPSL